MTIMGPRPERPQMVNMLAEQIPGYWNRLAVQPGITGLAQINLPPDTDLNSVRRKLQLDLEYIREASFGLELRMFIWTWMRLACIPADFATSLLRLTREPQGCTPNDESSDQPSDRPLTIDRILSFEAEAAKR